MTRRAALVLATVVLAACGGGDGISNQAAEGADAGETLPDVELVGLETGEVTSLSDIDGPAVINLWATWCAPCRAEIPDFEEVHQQRADDVRFVGVNVGDDASAARSFIDDVGATYDQFLDPGGEVATALRATAMPVTVVIDGDGVITTRHLGPLDQDGLNDAIDDALGISST